MDTSLEITVDDNERSTSIRTKILIYSTILLYISVLLIISSIQSLILRNLNSITDSIYIKISGIQIK